MEIIEIVTVGPYVLLLVDDGTSCGGAQWWVWSDDYGWIERSA